MEKKKLLFFAKQNGKITLPSFDFVKSLMDVFSRDSEFLKIANSRLRSVIDFEINLIA